MRQVVDNLKGKEYINRDNVVALRKYIRVKNPNSSGEELSAVFADALHKIIDTRIYQFDEKHRKKIKDDVLRKAVKKREFSINGAEIFSSCLSLKLHEDSYIESFTQWINQNQSILVSVEKVDKLVSSVELLEEEYIENNLDDIIDEFEGSWAEDETMTLLGLEITEAAEPQAYVEIPRAADDYNDNLDDTAEAKWIETVNELIDISTVELEDNVLNQVEAAAYQADVENETAEAPRLSLKKLFGSIYKLAASALGSRRYIRPSMKLALPAVLSLAIITVFTFTNPFSNNRIQGLQHQDQGRYANVVEDQVDRYLSLESKMAKRLDGSNGQEGLILLDGLQDELKYKEVDGKKLKRWLDNKNSMLAEEPYFTAIIAASKQYDVHPLLMFAIVGQEQAFVPKSYASAKKIANNPFNVYGSWEKYNTNIYDSSRLAADTIIKSSQNRPVYMNTIRWINRRYAEDPNWWNGVSMLFAQLEKDIANEK